MLKKEKALSVILLQRRWKKEALAILETEAGANTIPDPEMQFTGLQLYTPLLSFYGVERRRSKARMLQR